MKKLFFLLLFNFLIPNNLILDLDDSYIRYYGNHPLHSWVGESEDFIFELNNNNDKYHDFFDKMFEKIMMYKDRLSSQQISTISMGLARLNYKSILSSSFSSSYSSSSSSSSANNCSENILKTLSSSALNVISEFTFQDLENCLVSLEKLDVKQIGKKEFGYKKLLKSAVTRAAVLFEMKEGENNGMDIQKTFIEI